MSAIKEWMFGTHHARWEYPDVLHVTYQGPTRVVDVDKVLDICREMAVERPIFVISDISRSSIDREARGHFSRNLRPEWFHGLIYVGADAHQRATAKTIVIDLYFTGRWKVDIEFASSVEEAQGLVSRIRRARAEAAGARRPSTPPAPAP